MVIFIALVAAGAVAIADVLPPNWDKMTTAEKDAYRTGQQRMREERQREFRRRQEQTSGTATVAAAPGKHSKQSDAVTSGTHHSRAKSDNSGTPTTKPDSTL